MSNFEKLFVVFWCSSAIIWGSFLAVKVGTERDKTSWEHVISIAIMVSLVTFILAKLG